MKVKKVSNNILRYIDEHIEEALTVGNIANEAGYSEYHFSRIFKDETKMKLKDYVIRRKLIKASEKNYCWAEDNRCSISIWLGITCWLYQGI